MDAISQEAIRSRTSIEVQNSKVTADHVDATAGTRETRPELPVWRLWIIIFCLCFGLLLSTLETSIVATALVNIASSLGDYKASNWIVVAYLLTYTGFMIIYARLSDIFGRKPALLAAVGIFGVFSLGCGLANSMRTLIILRAFQGMGGSGIYSMVFAVSPEILNTKHFSIFSGLIGAVYACSSILGPILGGVIVHNSSWRWVFLLNVPCTSLIFILLLMTYPKGHTLTHRTSLLHQIDTLGLFLSLAFSILLVFVLEQAGTVYPWSNPVIISILVIAGSTFILFILWESFLPRIFTNPPLPALPLRLFSQRVLVFAFLTGFLSGIPFTTTLILLPTRYQLVQSLTPLHAGLRMLPLLLSSALGSGLGGIAGRYRRGPFLALLCGCALTVLGLGLMATLGPGQAVLGKEYGFLVVLGLGFGGSMSTLLVAARVQVGGKDSAILMATLTQLRVLGGCIGLGLSNTLLATHSAPRLAALLDPAQIEAVRDSAARIADLPLQVADQVRRIYGDAFDLNAKVMLGIAAAALVSSLGLWGRGGKTLAEVKEEQGEWEWERKREAEREMGRGAR